ncbi:MAG: hypothetical protein WAX77_11045 [Methylococcaceae bacterium]
MTAFIIVKYCSLAFQAYPFSICDLLNTLLNQWQHYLIAINIAIASR